ncbi:Ras association domain-containing protein 2 [Armadillidium nasatum]|uniref:Ras association domain-containing protein 2 n=1 Tax=Armadillidium nasatum TaxID=96803 RepID=A0A5N5TJW7_9CRUS|nr:Ras association domain-containing protein 2 [Armadillidium nasatum]
MWYCRKCSKPVFFAERKQSLGFDWHPNCLRCEECGKRLNPGQHAEHKGVPYCHHPCYGALFGPQLFGHGTRNECHTSFGKVENRDGQANGRLVLEGVLRIYWGVKNIIHLKEEDDSRMIATRRKSCAESKSHPSFGSDSDDDDNSHLHWRENSANMDLNRQNSNPETKMSYQNASESEVKMGRPHINGNNYHSNSFMFHPASDREGNNISISSHRSKFENSEETISTFPAEVSSNNVNSNDNNDKIEKTSNRSGSTAIRRRSGRRMEKARLKRRCSINGHFYLRETSSFTPPYGSPCSIWITSKTTAEEVLNIVLDKYKVEMSASNFALFVVKDTGELKRIREDESPLVTRVMLGPHEDVSKVFIMDAQRTREISHEVAQFLNLSLTECRAILMKYEQEEMKYLQLIKKK